MRLSPRRLRRPFERERHRIAPLLVAPGGGCGGRVGPWPAFRDALRYVTGCHPGAPTKRNETKQRNETNPKSGNPGRSAGRKFARKSAKMIAIRARWAGTSA